MRLTLMVLMGLPAAGKSTYAGKQLGYVTYTADSIRAGERPFAAFARVAKGVEETLRAQRSVIVDACSLLPANRVRMLHLGRAAGAYCVLTVLETDTSICLRREVARGGPVRDWSLLAQQLITARNVARREGWDSIRGVRP